MCASESIRILSTYYYYYESLFGKLLLVSDGANLNGIGLPNGKMKRQHELSWVNDIQPFKKPIAQLEAYFRGERKSFDLAVSLSGTSFQTSVWKALKKIPYGKTWSYREVAGYIGRPRASRAVGSANGLNPIPIIIPCHRVIGSNGSLAGFGGGVRLKKSLLDLEARNS